ncbi:MAG: BamA/TamA family outer membrane protein [Ignavibacteriales bacterium]|nr:BamA/TamA family outer membrane protein [Ignavibacteriales bacterium]
MQSLIEHSFVDFRWFSYCAVLLWLSIVAGRLDAQAKKNGFSDYEVAKISLKIDGPVTEEQLRAIMTTEETPPALWTFLYKNVYKTIGSKPSYFERSRFDDDVAHVRVYLAEEGYFHAQVDTTIAVSDRDREVSVGLCVVTGRRSMVDTLTMYGLALLDPETAAEVTVGALLKRGDSYTKNALDQERLRLLRLFQKNGYMNAVLDSVAAVRFLSSDNFSITFGFHLGDRYVFGPVDINLDRGIVEEKVVMRQLDFEQGQIFNNEKKVESEQNLNRLGIFENAKIESMSPVDSAKPPYVPLRILLRGRDLQEVTPEFLVDNENDALNAGLGLGYSHRNFFGEARNFSTRVRFRLQSIDNLDLNEAVRKGFAEPSLLAKVDAQTQLVWPYVYSNRLSASWALSAEYEKQRYYLLNILRSRAGLTNKYTTYTLGFVDWYLERVGVDISDTNNVKPASFTGSRQIQFNSILTLSLQRDKTNDVFSPSAGFFHSIAVEEAGALPRVLGNLGSGLPFAEYYKVSFFLRHYFCNDDVKGVVWAIKFRGGFAELYNNANQTPVPPTRKFYAGGSGSIRGWKSRDLAAFDKPDEGGNVDLEGSVESRIRLFIRPQKLWGFLNLDNLGVAVFVDYGNVWNSLHDVRMHDVAVAAGVGLRYETFVGPLRVDVGLKMYDPKESSGREWIMSRPFFREGMAVHFGIGQAP